MEEDKSILDKLDVIIKLLAHNIIKDLNQKESILFLDSLNLKNKQISEITGASLKTISVRKAEAKKDKGKKNGRE